MAATAQHGERRSAARGCARRSSATASSLVPMGFFLLFFIFPIGYAVYISRYDWGVFGKIDTLGWDNYRALYHDEVFWRAVKNTLLYTAGRRPGRDGARPHARRRRQPGIRGRTFFRSAFYFPSIASSAAITAIAIYILSADGLLNTIIGGQPSVVRRLRHGAVVDRRPERLDDLRHAHALLPRRAAGDPDRRLRGGRDRRRRTWRTFWKITFPLLKPGHFFVAVVSVIGALQVFDQAFIVSDGSGGPNYSTLTVVLYLYRPAIQTSSSATRRRSGSRSSRSSSR